MNFVLWEFYGNKLLCTFSNFQCCWVKFFNLLLFTSCTFSKFQCIVFFSRVHVGFFQLYGYALLLGGRLAYSNSPCFNWFDLQNQIQIDSFNSTLFWVQCCIDSSGMSLAWLSGCAKLCLGMIFSRANAMIKVVALKIDSTLNK